MKPHCFLLAIILPLTVGAQNTNSEKVEEDQAFSLEQADKQQEEWQKARIKELQPKAEQGDSEAQYDLGLMLLWEGADRFMPRSMEPNPEGLKWLRKAAEQGSTIAQLELGQLFRHRSDTADEAAKWLRAAADQGVARAQYELGNCYELGEGVPTNYPEAAALYLKAAEQGHEFAQERLGHLYSEGKGVPRNLRETYIWNFITKASGGSKDLRAQRMARMMQKTSGHEKAEDKLTESELAEAQEEALRRLVEIAKRVNASESAE